MTEAEWLTGTDFAAQARFAAESLSPRRQRLLAAALCRAVGHLIDHPVLLHALDVVEQSADGRAAPGAMDAARQQCRELAQQAWDTYATHVDRGLIDPSRPSLGVGRHVLSELAWAVAFAATSPVPADQIATKISAAVVEAQLGVVLVVAAPTTEFNAATAEQARYMREVVWDVTGNPFRAVEFSPEWRTDTVLALARQMYDAREFSAMPILADALQDAGCSDEEILSHCREPGEHFRGCWVLDGVLGKERGDEPT